MGGAQIVGHVVMAPGSNVWYNAVLRADCAAISLGARSSIGDGTVVTVAEGKGVEIGEDSVVLSHSSLHACRIGSNVYIGQNCVILEGATVGDNARIEPGTVIPPGVEVPANAIPDMPLPEAKGIAEANLLLCQVHRRRVPDTSFVYGIAAGGDVEEELPESPPDWLKNM